MQRSGTSREFTVKRQGHILNYVYKLRYLLAKLPGRVYVQEVGSLQGVMSKIYKSQKKTKSY
jgi:hypothetical protein